MAYLKKRKIESRVVEKWIRNPKSKFGGFRKDHFGADLQALLNDGTLNIQCGSGPAHTKKVKEALAHPEVSQWIAKFRLFWVWTWAKKTKGERNSYTPRVTAIVREGGNLVAKPFTLRG